MGNRSELLEIADDPENGVRITRGVDPSEKERNRFKERFPEAEVYSRYQELLSRNDLDGVFILSPDYLHKEHACAFLKKGIPVFLEKPIAITIEDADTILTTARETGTKLFIGHNMRFFPCIQKMKEIIQSGAIGRIEAIWCRHFIAYGGDAYFRDWHSERKFSTGLLLQKAAHDIDVIHWLAEACSKRVVGMGKLSVYDKLPRRSPESPGDAQFKEEHWPPEEQSGFSPHIDVEDHSMMLMELENGVQASYMQCHYTPDTYRNYTVIGTKGRIENIGDHGECTIHLYNQRCNSHTTASQSFHLHTGEDDHGGADPSMITDFIEYLRSDHSPRTSPLAGREAVAAGFMATESLRNGNIPCQIPPVSPENRKYFSVDRSGESTIK